MASHDKAVRGAYENVLDGTLYTPDSLLTFEPGVNIRDSTGSLLDHQKMAGTVVKYLCDDYEATYLINGTVKFPTSTSLAHKKKCAKDLMRGSQLAAPQLAPQLAVKQAVPR